MAPLFSEIERHAFLPFLIWGCLTFAPFRTHAQDEVYVNIGTRPGVSQSFMLIKPAHPVAAVVLFTGGGGVLDLSPAGYGGGRNNFLVRSRQIFAAQGFVVAVVDLASDFKERGDNPEGVRLTEAHARDVQAVIAYLRKQAQVPVWLVGTSRGTISVVNAAVKLQDEPPDGIVLTSSVTRGRQETVYDVDLKRIRMPVLLVHNARDKCKVSPYDGMAALAKKLVNAAKLKTLTFRSDVSETPDACQAMTAHGFLGVEEQVVNEIGAWIKNPS